MSAAAAVVQAALVAALAADSRIAAAVSGVHDGPPARAAFPYVAIDGGTTSDWSVKDASGREHRIAITIWDDGRSPARLHGLMAAAEEAIEAMDEDLDGHRIASILFVRGRVVRDAAGPWAGMIEYRVRTLATERAAST
ncbi:DUF3168 domain-containing protein [Sphingomonas quercus]|uniref:DUF3168 domain-containing protein n=1 Tax=Sphingomonas quercus TaxID=2842451 RepID=A0ABS6BJV7_9SPHN|nr:DUF3168 domain-containing protein [Sphingomonas quercus]MBU3078469.1 DUF3168 domain-containing protein [Sphingomonas quercus]